MKVICSSVLEMGGPMGWGAALYISLGIGEFQSAGGLKSPTGNRMPHQLDPEWNVHQ